MPTYDYSCAACGSFDAIRPMSRRDEPADCPVCGGMSQRVFASAPSLALLDSGTRNALDTNERARHEPTSSRDYSRLRHKAGCGCCSPGARRGATVTGANGNKAFVNKRPWMISH
jgi:putative FmdB family regulatory protein